MNTMVSLDTAFRDFKYALRTLARTPGFTVIAILTLALGIGANTAIFTLLDQILLRHVRPFPLRRQPLLQWPGGARSAGNGLRHLFFHPRHKSLPRPRVHSGR